MSHYYWYVQCTYWLGTFPDSVYVYKMPDRIGIHGCVFFHICPFFPFLLHWENKEIDISCYFFIQYTIAVVHIAKINSLFQKLQFLYSKSVFFQHAYSKIIYLVKFLLLCTDGIKEWVRYSRIHVWKAKNYQCNSPSKLTFNSIINGYLMFQQYLLHTSYFLWGSNWVVFFFIIIAKNFVHLV